MEEFDFELLKEELLTQPIEGKVDKEGGQLFHRNSTARLWLRNVSSNGTLFEPCNGVWIYNDERSTLAEPTA